MSLELETIKQWAGLISGVFGAITVGSFGVQIYREKKPVNLASWITVFIGDLAGSVLLLAHITGFPPKMSLFTWENFPYAQIGWTVASVGIVAAAIHVGGERSWTKTEKIVVALCVVAIPLRFAGNEWLALATWLVSAYVGIYPQVLDYWRKPDPSAAWLWKCTTAVNVLWLSSLPVYTAKDMTPPVTFLFLSIGMIWLLLRKK